MRKNLFIVSSVALILGCGGDEGEIKKITIQNLKDPDSAKFGDVQIIENRLACLTVNAKNSMGGFTGNQLAFLRKEGGKWEFYFIEDFPKDMCLYVWKELEKSNPPKGN